MDKSNEEYAVEEAAGIDVSLAFKREGYVNIYLLFWEEIKIIVLRPGGSSK